MGYADVFSTRGSSAAAEEEGFRASLVRKRHSLFGGRNESMSSSFDLHAPPMHVSAVQGVLYHTLPEGDQVATGDRKAVDAVDSRRRSFFGGRFAFGAKKEQTGKRDSSVPTLRSQEHEHHRQSRDVSAQADVSHITEDDYYRNLTKSTISPPFHFQHIAHTRKKHLPALNTLDEKDLDKEFWAASSSQVPRRHLRGIQADDLSTRPEAMGIMRGSEKSRPTTPARVDKNKPLPIPKPARSSCEDITALPSFDKPKRSMSRMKRDNVGLLVGPQEKEKSVPADATQASAKVRADTYTALFGFRQSTDSRTSKDDMGNLLGFTALSTKQASDAAKPGRPSTERSKRLSGATRSQKADRATQRDISSLLGFKERSMSESSHGSSSKSKREDINALLGIREESSKRDSKQSEIDALLGIPKRTPKKFEPMAPPAPPRPRRPDEALKLRTEIVPSVPLPQPHAPPDRPARDSKDVQYLREMGFGQLLYRENSNESRNAQSLRREISNESRPGQTSHQPNSPSLQQEQTLLRETNSQQRLSGQHLFRQNSNESHHSPNTSPAFSRHSPREADGQRYPSSDAAPLHPGIGEDFTRAQQVHYRSRQPLPAIPKQNNMTPEGRSPLQTVREVGETHSPLQTSTNPAISPISPSSLQSAHRLVRSPELTGTSMPDDGTWEHEVELLYSKEAEASHNFDWDSVSMASQRLSVREPDKRRSLNVPSGATHDAARLSKRISEGSLRSSIYMPAALNIQPQTGHRGYAPKPMSPVDEYASGGAQVSPIVRVLDVDDHKQRASHPVSSLHMHGYESIAAGYLSDPESNSERSQHRKSNSYSSWESRPSIAKEPARYSNASISNVPELAYPRRLKQPILSIPDYQPQQEETQLTHPINEYAAFSRGPYAQQSDSPTSSDYVSTRRPESTSQSTILRLAATRTAKDPHTDTQRWSRGAQNLPASPYPQAQHSGWI